MDSDYWRDGYLIRRRLVPEEMIDTLNQRFAAIAVHYASSHCQDIWHGETKTIGNFNPRLDIRLTKDQDPHNYAHNPATQGNGSTTPLLKKERWRGQARRDGGRR